MQNLEKTLDAAVLPVASVHGNERDVVACAHELRHKVARSEVEQVRKGCLASCSLDYVELGRQTGHMIADILEGASADDIPYLYLDEGYTVDYNAETLARFGLALPAAYEDANKVTAE